MANDFSGDSNCKALWRFEDGALTTDSKGGNTLTASASSPTADTTNFKEGAASALFTKANSQYFYSTDADLDAGFPLKNGDANKIMSFCCWFRLTSNPGASQFYDIFGKWQATKASFLLRAQNYAGYKLPFFWGKGATYEEIDVDGFTNPSSGKWYHIGVVLDGVSKTAFIRLYDVNLDTITDTENTPAGEISATDADLQIGAEYGPANFPDADIDELVVFDDLLTEDEIDNIRRGYYPDGPPSPTQDQLMRHGSYFLDGVKQPFWWAK